MSKVTGMVSHDFCQLSVRALRIHCNAQIILGRFPAVSTNTYAYARTHIYIYMYICTHVYVRMYIDIYLCTYARVDL